MTPPRKKSIIDLVLDAADDFVKREIAKTTPRPQPPRQSRADQGRSEASMSHLRSKHEVQLNRLLAAARRDNQLTQDVISQAILGLNDAFERVHERWPDMPGTQQTGAFQANDLTSAVGYAKYLIGLVGPRTEAEREPGDTHIFDSDGSRTKQEAQTIIQELTDQQRADEATIVKQARRIEELEGNLGRTLEALNNQSGERRVSPRTSATYRLIALYKTASRYEVEVQASNGATQRFPATDWLKWSRA